MTVVTAAVPAEQTAFAAEPAYRADLNRARQALLAAELADQPADRFLAAHLGALRVAAAVLAVAAHRTGRGRPADVRGVGSVLRRRPRHLARGLRRCPSSRDRTSGRRPRPRRVGLLRRGLTPAR